MLPSPLTPMFDRSECVWEHYGPPDAAIGIVGMFDFVDLEYAAIRKACGMLDLPQRGTLVVTGPDRLAFLNRMVTQELKGVTLGMSRDSFWLNRKGRIDADLRLIVREDRVMIDVDAHATSRAKQGLEAFIVADDVAIEDATQRLHRLALHGPGAANVLARYASGADLASIAPDTNTATSIDGVPVIIDRRDTTGEIGLELTIPVEHAVRVYQTLLQAAHENQPGHEGPNPRPLLRPIGWHAYNIARIEAGTPLYLLDFGPDSLPAETGVIDQRVSFKKGCYLGQEIVARMHALGQPKCVVCALRVEDPEQITDQPMRQPLGGAPVLAAMPEAGKEPEIIGAVTSTTTSPMLGGVGVAFAVVKHKHSSAGSRVFVPCVRNPDDEPVLLPAGVQDGLVLWKR